MTAMNLGMKMTVNRRWMRGYPSLQLSFSAKLEI